MRLHDVDDIIFVPSAPMMKLKAAFWNRHNSQDIVEESAITKGYILSSLRDEGQKRLLEAHWGNKGFQDWLLNKEEVRDRIEYMFDLAMNEAEAILRNPEANMNAKVSLIKHMSELANKLPEKTSADKFIDAEISKMDPQRLDAYIKSKTRALKGTS